ncbi:terpene synthase-like [Bicyclus anynana]|uniref:Terpene synthase-like n=1 Tax=Bicyclus anynana TaxID=110368 RepID=A0ABM3LNQ7_BICAN|nr:terpene synthase-like [Bicyclus anynana]
MEKYIMNNKLKFEKEILAPYTYLNQKEGKKIRVKIANAFNHWLKLSDEKLREIVESVVMIYNASLLLDDILDSTNLRRGIPSAHRVYGIPLTLNTTLHVLFLVLNRFVELHPEAAEIYGTEILDGLRGQGADLYWRDTFHCPTVQDYNKMAQQKTGRMFTLGLRLCQLFSDNKTDMCSLALQLGLYFQIRDDYCNLQKPEALEEWPTEDNKKAVKVDSFCEDLTEGKYTLAIIHAMSTPHGEEVLNILRQRTEDIELKKYCVALLEKSGSLAYVRSVLEDLNRSIRAEVARLGGNPQMEAVLDEMESWKN